MLKFTEFETITLSNGVSYWSKKDGDIEICIEQLDNDRLSIGLFDANKNIIGDKYASRAHGFNGLVEVLIEGYKMVRTWEKTKK